MFLAELRETGDSKPTQWNPERRKTGKGLDDPCRLEKKVGVAEDILRLVNNCY